ncbi:MAG: hypothetical protein JRE21_05075 [Deltaproteobacteria bacterium]|jgi:hypothetical protein|nr:hypothetical protein [Deltaproteobacteria bacterium]
MPTVKTTLRKHESLQRKRIAPVDLQEGYQVNIRLVRIVGGKAHGIVCLRGGDDWHREILKNTEAEIKGLGFQNAIVTPAGGAWVRFEPDGAIVLYGSSDEFGTCDKKTAADLMGRAFPGRKILVREY